MNGVPEEVIVAGLEAGMARLQLDTTVRDFVKSERERLDRERRELRTFELVAARMLRG